jgi:hypothetical protein
MAVTRRRPPPKPDDVSDPRLAEETTNKSLKTSSRDHQLCGQHRWVECPIAYPVRTGGRDWRRLGDGHSGMPDVWC